jgi:hypothetical protein
LPYNARMRFTLGTIFLTVAILALACAGTLYHSRRWLDITISATILLYVIVAVRAVGSTGVARIRAIAFALAGSCYLVLAVSPIRPMLITNYAIAAAVRAAFPHELIQQTPGMNAYAPIGTVEFTTVLENVATSIDLRHSITRLVFIGHCVFSWIFAVLAAWFAGWMYDRRERATKEAT